jgi:hypothetical protein
MIGTTEKAAVPNDVARGGQIVNPLNSEARKSIFLHYKKKNNQGDRAGFDLD